MGGCKGTRAGGARVGACKGRRAQGEGMGGCKGLCPFTFLPSHQASHLMKLSLPDILFQLVHDKFAKVLVEEKGYDTSLLEPFEKHRDLWYISFCIFNYPTKFSYVDINSWEIMLGLSGKKR